MTVWGMLAVYMQQCSMKSTVVTVADDRQHVKNTGLGNMSLSDGRSVFLSSSSCLFELFWDQGVFVICVRIRFRH